MVSVAKHLPSNHKALNSTPSTAKKKKKKNCLNSLKYVNVLKVT
jgi:hypothetical protein